jgi:AcrR family transcriptional regulator
MSMNANDLRVRRTLDSIQSALAALVAKKGLDSVTVADIARRARVNRTTFYRHYRDKYDLLERMLAKAIEELDESMGPPKSRRSRFNLDKVPEPWIRFFERIELNAGLYRAILQSAGSAWFQARLRKHVERLLSEEGLPLSPRKRGSSNADLPPEITVAFSASLFIGVALWWLEYGKAYGASRIATWLRAFFIRGFAGLVPVNSVPVNS